MAAGVGYSAAQRPDGTVCTWGWGADGQLGTGQGPQLSPVPVLPADRWLAASAGDRFTAAIRQDGTLWAWGNNTHNQLGIGPTWDQLAPVQVGTATTWRSVAAGGTYTVAIRQDDTLWAWGDNTSGQLGLGTTLDQPVPVQTGGAAAWLSVAAGGAHTVAVRQDGTLWAWGNNAHGQLGTATATATQSVPVQVGTATTWRAVAARGGSTLAVRTDHTLWGWGQNDKGQLGLGSRADQPASRQLGTGTAWATPTISWDHALALRQDGTLWAWGDNESGMLGGYFSSNAPDCWPVPSAPLAVRSPALAQWSLAPNPAHGTVQLRGLPAGPVATQLFDAQGRLVRTAPTPTLGLDGLVPGLYLLRATAGATTQTLRLVVE